MKLLERKGRLVIERKKMSIKYENCQRKDDEIVTFNNELNGWLF